MVMHAIAFIILILLGLVQLVNTFRLVNLHALTQSSSSPFHPSTTLFSKEVVKKRARYNVNRHRRGIIKKKFRGFPQTRKRSITISDEDFMKFHRVNGVIPNGTEIKHSMNSTSLKIPHDCAIIIQECTLVGINEANRGCYRIKGEFPGFLISTMAAEAKKELQSSKKVYPGFRPGHFPVYAAHEIKKSKIIQAVINMVLLTLAENGVAICDDKSKLVELSGESIKPIASSKKPAAEFENRALTCVENEDLQFELEVMGRKLGSRIIYSTQEEGKERMKDNKKEAKSSDSTNVTEREKVIADEHEAPVDISPENLEPSGTTEDSSIISHLTTSLNETSISPALEGSHQDAIDGSPNPDQPKKRGRKPKVISQKKESDSSVVVEKPKRKTRKAKNKDIPDGSNETTQFIEIDI